MNYRFNYPICQLHEEPLNYICLHANCKSNRYICIFCQSQRHSEGHHTRPLKMYMTQKVHKLKCLTQTQIQNIVNGLYEAKNDMEVSLTQLKCELHKKIEDLKCQIQAVYDQQIQVMENCGNLMNEEEIPLDHLKTVQKILTISSKYENYQDAVQSKINEYKNSIESILMPVNFQQVLENVNWLHKENISVHNNILHSNSSEYKITFLEKPLKFKNFETKFKILKNPKNWITVGICHRKIVQSRNYSFRYHTIGHGVYGISSNGGSWSHYRPQFNNTLSAPQFKQNQIVKVRYDSAYNTVKFVLEGGEKYSLDVDPLEKGFLNFCVIMYFEDDEVQMLTE